MKITTIEQLVWSDNAAELLKVNEMRDNSFDIIICYARTTYNELTCAMLFRIANRAEVI